jgi:hypothetical protein
MNILMIGLFKEYTNKKLNFVKLPNGVELSIQNQNSEFYETIYPFICEEDKMRIINQAQVRSNKEDNKAILRSIVYFKKMRKKDIAIVIITSDILPMIIKKINDIDILEGYKILLEDGQRVVITIENISKIFNLLQNTISGNTFATIYHRKGTSIIVDNEEIFNTTEFKTPDLLVLSDVNGESFANLFLADILERLINRDNSIEKLIKKNLNSKFLKSIEPMHIYKRYLYFEESSIKSYQQLLDVIYELVKKDEECQIWNMTLDFAYLFYLDLKGEEHECI